MNITTAQLVTLAKESEFANPIDWDDLSIDQDQAYNLMALSVIEMMQALDTDEQRMYVAMASMTHLIVENFTLNKTLLDK